MLRHNAVNQTRISLFDSIPRSAFEEARRLFHKVNSPLLLGEVSLEIGWSLERTQDIIDTLIVEGSVKQGSVADAQVRGAVAGAAVYVLHEPRKLALAHR